MGSTYDVSLNGLDNLLDPLPVIGVLGLSVYDLEALKDVDNVVDSSSFNCQLSSALIKIEQRPELASIDAQEAPAQLTKTLFFATVLEFGAARESLGGILIKFNFFMRTQV